MDIEETLLVLALAWLGQAVLTAAIAARHAQSGVLWFFGGLVFPGPAFLAALLVPFFSKASSSQMPHTAAMPVGEGEANCPVCHGSGKGASCGACGGSGSTAVWEADPISMQNRMVTKPCMRCQMSGRVAYVFCGGAGKIHSGA